MSWYELVAKGRAQAFAQAPEAIRALVRDAEQHAVDHLVLSGDLTASALPSEFAGAASALGEFTSNAHRCTVIPGNHDTHNPTALKKHLFEASFGSLLHSDLPAHTRLGPWPVVRLVGDELAVVALHTSLLPCIPGVAYGRVGPEQLDGLRAVLADRALLGRAVLVVVHHAPLRPDGRPDKLSHGLRDADALLALLPGPRFAVLHGHIHQRYSHAATSQRPHLFGAGSSTQADRRGYWLIEVAGGKVQGGTAHSLDLGH
jgi:3',5'-cyclic AMP phosphodiesterase CpdA